MSSILKNKRFHEWKKKSASQITVVLKSLPLDVIKK